MTTELFSGSISKTGTSQSEFDIQVARAGPITATLDASSTGQRTSSLQLFVLSGGVVVASDTTATLPRVLTYAAPGPGTFTLRVVATSGKADFTLTVTHP